MTILSPSPSEVAEAAWQFYASPPSPTAAGDALDALADQFIELKRHLGHRYHRDGGYVRDFLRFQRSRGVSRVSQLSIDAVLAWAATRAHVQPLTWAREVGALSVFMDHLKSIGKVTNNLCLFLRRRTRPNYRPYIFTVEELGRIFALEKAPGPVRDRALIYRLMYACGLRVSEATHLKLRDFDPGQGTIFIEKTKFNKDRLLPLHVGIVERLRRYRDERRSKESSGSVFFVNAAGGPYRRNHLSHAFQQDLSRLDLYRPTRDADGVRLGSPRLHGLRHCFAIYRLLKWYREGADVQAKLPLLSTYLGHSAVEYTQVYLKATGLLLREAHRRFASRWEKELPLKP